MDDPSPRKVYELICECIGFDTEDYDARFFIEPFCEQNKALSRALLEYLQSTKNKVAPDDQRRERVLYYIGMHFNISEFIPAK